MKKFLHLALPGSAKEVPEKLNVKILAAAAMRANHFRKKRMVVRITLSSLATAAAAVFVITALPSAELNTVTPAIQSSAIQKQNNIAAAINKTTVVTVPEIEVPAPAQRDLLALADTTLLEQESYNLATMAELSLDGDILTI